MSLNTARKKILVIDDDADWRTTVAMVLEGAFDVAFASDGEEGLRMARAFQPAVVVLDIMLPGGKDGLTVFCELRNGAATRSIPVVVLSAVNEAAGLGIGIEEMRRYLGCAPEAFIEKPGTLSALRNEVLRLAAGSAPGRKERP